MLSFVSALSSVEKVVQSTHQNAEKTKKETCSLLPCQCLFKNIKKGHVGFVAGSMVLFPVVALEALVELTWLTLLKFGLPKKGGTPCSGSAQGIIFGRTAFFGVLV